MAKLLKGLFLVFALSAVVVACGSKDSNNTNGYNPYYPYGYNPQNTQEYKGTLKIANGSLYQQYLIDMMLCSNTTFIFTVNTCTNMKSSPLVSLRFNQLVGPTPHQTSSTTATNTAQYSLQPMNSYGYPVGIPQAFQLKFFPTNNNENLEADATGFVGTGSYNADIRIVIVGKDGDESITLNMYYRSQTLGQATLRRANPYAYPSPYGNPYNPGNPSGW